MKRSQIDKSIVCPNCDDLAKLVSDLNDVYVGKINKKIWIEFLNYQCDFCEESYTTTEVDEINLQQINKGVRNFKRQLKIQKLLK